VWRSIQYCLVGLRPGDNKVEDVKFMGNACLAADSSTHIHNSGLALTYEPTDPLRWFAIKVRSGGEPAAAMALSMRGLEVYSPMRQERRRYSDRMKVVQVAMFPGYIFCRFDISKKVTVLSCRGIEYIVGFSGEPTPINESDLHGIRRLIELGADITPRLEAGQRVRVIRGPLKGVDGVLLRDGKGPRLAVTIELLRRSVALHVNEEDLCIAG
jgi:transcription antitermination factor NusG